MMLRALVFDFDGLILDTEVPQYLTVKAEFEAHGVERSLEAWLDIIGRVDHDHWVDWLEREVGAPIARDVVRARRLVQHHQMIMANEVLPGVVELLDQAEARGIPAAVASSSHHDWVCGHLDRLGLLPRFAVTVTREQVERAKPWPDLFLAALDQLGVGSRGSVALEDSRNGCVAAQAAGMFCVVAPNELTRRQDLTHADLVVPSLLDLDLDDLDRLVARSLSAP